LRARNQGPHKDRDFAQSHQTALKKPAVYSPKVETGQRRGVLRVKSIIEVLSVLARHTQHDNFANNNSKNGSKY
jgi:hypothetical protein